MTVFICMNWYLHQHLDLHFYTQSHLHFLDDCKSLRTLLPPMVRCLVSGIVFINWLKIRSRLKMSIFSLIIPLSCQMYWVLEPKDWLLELLNQVQARYIPYLINDVILSDFLLPSDFDWIILNCAVSVTLTAPKWLVLGLKSQVEFQRPLTMCFSLFCCLSEWI